jgi:hypothetical protein
MIWALRALAFLIVFMFVALAVSAFMAAWLKNIRRATALADDSTYGAPEGDLRDFRD